MFIEEVLSKTMSAKKLKLAQKSKFKLISPQKIQVVFVENRINSSIIRATKWFCRFYVTPSPDDPTDVEIESIQSDDSQVITAILFHISDSSFTKVSKGNRNENSAVSNEKAAV